jgi:hypothetical protein
MRLWYHRTVGSATATAMAMALKGTHVSSFRVAMRRLGDAVEQGYSYELSHGILHNNVDK